MPAIVLAGFFMPTIHNILLLRYKPHLYKVVLKLIDAHLLGNVYPLMV